MFIATRSPGGRWITFASSCRPGSASFHDRNCQGCRDLRDRIAMRGPGRLTVTAQAVGHPRRAQVLDVLRHAGEPLGAAEIAERTGIHVNTARFHLDALVSDGTVSQELEQSAGPGRPRAVYAVRPGMDRGYLAELYLPTLVVACWAVLMVSAPLRARRRPTAPDSTGRLPRRAGRWVRPCPSR